LLPLQDGSKATMSNLMTFTTKAFLLSTALFLPIVSTGQARAEEHQLVPHRAAYELTLHSVKGKSISNASGRIGLEFLGNACEGYATNFRQVTQIADGEGRSQTSDMQMTTFESGDGKALRFNGKKRTNEGRQETTVGSAERANDGGLSIDVREPKLSKIDVDGVAIFPTDHMLQLIAGAKKGVRIREVKVYDGSDGGTKVFDTTALIGTEIPETGRVIEEPSEKAGMKSVRRWPVSISYFEPGSGERTPVYVLSFDMFENGVSGALKLDFGDFSLKGEMKRLELLKPTDCKK
jgi:EipB-like